MKAGVVCQHVDPAAVFGYGHIQGSGIQGDVTKNFQIDFGAAGLPQSDTDQYNKQEQTSRRHRVLLVKGKRPDPVALSGKLA